MMVEKKLLLSIFKGEEVCTECKKLRKMLLKPPGVNLFNSNFNVGHASQFPQCSTKRNIALLLVKEKKPSLYVQRIWSWKMLLVEAMVGTPHTFQNFYSWKNWPKECKVHAAYIHTLFWTPIYALLLQNLLTTFKSTIRNTKLANLMVPIFYSNNSRNFKMSSSHLR